MRIGKLEHRFLLNGKLTWTERSKIKYVKLVYKIYDGHYIHAQENESIACQSENCVNLSEVSAQVDVKSEIVWLGKEKKYVSSLVRVTYSYHCREGW